MRKKKVPKKDKDWYIKHIEKPLRNLVKLLRNNGFNTTCSCGHSPKPYIEMELTDSRQIDQLFDLLIGNNYKNFCICTYWGYGRGYVYPKRHIRLEFYIEPELIKEPSIKEKPIK